jgi:rod shape-determining protein MreC
MRLKQPSRRILYVVLILLTIYLLALPRRWSAPSRMLALSLAAPVQKQVSRFKQFLSEAWAGLLARKDMANENRVLREKIAALENSWVRMKNDLIRAQEKVQSFDALAKLPSDEGLSPIDANVIAVDSSNWRSTIEIDQGAGRGIAVGQAVVWRDAAVGIVLEAAPSASRVRLLVDPECRIAAIDIRSREQGVIEGTGDGFCRLKHVSRDRDVRKGDLIVTSGIGGLFPPSILIGQVEESRTPESGLFREIKVRPRVELSRIENVVVLTKPHHDVKTARPAKAEGKTKPTK